MTRQAGFSFQSVGAASVADLPASSGSNSGGLFDRAVLLNLRIGKLGIRRKVSSGAVRTDADPDMIAVSKAILESERYEAITKFDGSVRTWLGKRALPSMFRSGVYLLPVDLVSDVDEFLTMMQGRRQGLIDAFLDEYRLSQQAAESRLGSLYDPRDYPDESRVRAAFGFDYQWIEFSTPGRLRGISSAMFERERLKAEGVWREALNEAQGLLRGELQGLVDHMLERLRPESDGKKKVFRDSLVSNLREFLELFAPRNIADDSELSAIVSRCREMLSADGVDAQALRDNETVRARVQAGMESIKTQLDTMVGAAATRRVQLSDDWADV